ncbi:response regulator transcription factor [Varunaivibrio sulfuroxidans]|uniref:LuxR family two component transcriptional regulator n=1 Tax=Varunaivibrio sulfuroxidans TaxID=1773489 RepID=A0A4R3JHK3_9PROT|nr:response regulator transcription factor [Varunaivibrio sulfuroxidans]TCS64270.1 LuxR family two component transcriptional regulator [Varunaivibrio sulfuroxidans]WES31292.1 response regulator transcription factor [Varunaivibrio sulfuroxidans]
MAEDKGAIEVVVADKSPLMLHALTQLFGGDDRFSLVATAADGERFMEAVDRLCFDVGVIGWNMPYMTGQGVLQSIKNTECPPKIVVFTGNMVGDVPRQVMHLGGAGFCSKTERPEKLIDTVVAVSEGRMVFPFMDLSRPSNDPFASLTAREQELLCSVAQGRTNAQIAGDLDISLNTVKFHLKNLYGKLDVKNRAQAVASYLNAHA